MPSDFFSKYFSGISEKVQFPGTIKLFRGCLYLFLLCNSLIHLPISSSIYGPDAFVLPVQGMKYFLFSIQNLLNRVPFSSYYLLFVCGNIFCLVLSLAGIRHWLIRLFVWLTASNLHYRCAILENSGNNFALIVLFFLIFMDEESDRSEVNQGFLPLLKIITTNLLLDRKSTRLNSSH